jgi:phage-related protein
VDDASSGWYEISTKNGITGYAKTSQLTFVRHETVQPIPPREVEDQLFRIYKVVINNDRRECVVNARHVSYDLSGVLLGECNISLAAPALAIARIQDAFMIPYRGEIATNMTGDENGTYTGDLGGKNGTAGFLDPDKGMIPYFRGKLIRDNWDLFLMKNDIADRGFRITYGVNMRGVTWTRNSDNMINRIFPVAKTADGEDLVLPEQFVDSPNISSWPVIRMERLKVDGQIGKDDGTGTETVWTEETLLAHMRTKAGERFSVDHVDAINVEVQVDFTNLGDTEEYKQYKDLQKVYLYDLVRVNDPNVGLNLQLQVSQTQFDCIAERYVGIRVGNVFDYGGRTVFGYNIGDDAIAYEKISLEAVRKIQSGVNTNNN